MAENRTMKVIHDPVVDRHVCGPGWVWHQRNPKNDAWPNIPDPPTGYLWRSPYDVPVGRVVECDCGATWICVRIPEQVSSRTFICARNEWHKETPKERERRENPSKKSWWRRG